MAPEAERGWKIIRTDRAPGYLGFLSQAVQIGDILIIGGQVPRDPQTLEIPKTFEEQAHLVFRNFKAVVEAAGTTMDNVCKVNVYLDNIRDWAVMNEIYKQYFSAENPPTRTTVQVARLNNNYMIEVEGMAWVPPNRSG